MASEGAVRTAAGGQLLAALRVSRKSSRRECSKFVDRVGKIELAFNRDVQAWVGSIAERPGHQ